MVLLLGDATVEATGLALAKEKARYFRFEALHTGTVETLELYLEKLTTAGEIEVGIFEEKGAEEVPGTLLAHASLLKPAVEIKEAWHAFTGLSAAVTSGKHYFLAVLNIGTEASLKYRTLTGTVKNTRKLSGTAVSLVSNPVVLASELPEKASFQALGTEGETKTVSAFVHGAGLSSVSALKVATPSALVHGAGLANVVSLKVALATAAVTGAGATKASVSKTATVTALVHGAGNATATIGTVEVKTVTALVHGAGRATVSALHVGVVTARVTGAGTGAASTRKIAIATAKVSGGGLAKAGIYKIALVTSAVTGAGRATVVIASGGPVNPCLITLTVRPTVNITPTVRPTVTIAPTVRPTVRIDLEAR